MNYSLDLLVEKILNNIDYQFIDTIKQQFPTNNPYFLACLAETINNFEDDKKEDVLDVIIDKAYKLYNNSNISAYLSNI